MNQYIAKYERLTSKLGYNEAISRARAHYGSLVIGRQFRETIEEWHSRCPEVAEFFSWLQSQTTA